MLYWRNVLPPLRRCVAHLYGERSAFGDVAVLDIWQLVRLAVELDALYVDVGIAVVYGLNNELAAFDGEFRAIYKR